MTLLFAIVGFFVWASGTTALFLLLINSHGRREDELLSQVARARNQGQLGFNPATRKFWPDEANLELQYRQVFLWVRRNPVSFQWNGALPPPRRGLMNPIFGPWGVWR